MKRPPQSARIVNDEDNQANTSFINRSKIDKKKARNKKDTKKYGIALCDLKNTLIFYVTKRERQKKYYEFKKEYPNARILKDNFKI